MRHGWVALNLEQTQGCAKLWKELEAVIPQESRLKSRKVAAISGVREKITICYPRGLLQNLHTAAATWWSRHESLQPTSVLTLTPFCNFTCF